MTYLLDANVLIALCDELHAQHAGVNRWFARVGGRSWASCPLTQNGFLRITSRTSYPRSTGSVAEQMKILRGLCALPGHEFWPDELSLLQAEIWHQSEQVRADDLTDLYLLGLAAEKSGKFVSLDRAIPAYRIRRGVECLVLL